MPNSAHLHLILNHFPVIGTGIIVFILLHGVVSKNDKIKKLALLLVVLISLMTIPVFITGGKAEGFVKGLDGVNVENIEPHEEFARFSFIAMEIVGALSLAVLLFYRKDKEIPLWTAASILVFLLVVCGMMIYTAHLGGKITHLELMEQKTNNLKTELYSRNLT